MSELSSREQELVALGAAIASNCVPCVEYHVPEARTTGLTFEQIREAIAIADRVRRVPARAVREAALARIENRARGEEVAPGTDCGCGSRN